jgi:hypothetical protein
MIAERRRMIARFWPLRLLGMRRLGSWRLGIWASTQSK